MASLDSNVGEPIPINKEYVEVIRSDIEIDKKFTEDPGLPTKIVYFCLECKKQVKPKRIGKKFKFSCQECNHKEVSFGTEKSIDNYYKNAHKK